LRAWLRAGIRKCDAIPDDETAAHRVGLPIGNLVALGCVKEALRHVNRFLRRIPRQKVLATVWVARSGAEISLGAGDLPRMERYLAIVEATEPFNTRKCDRGFSVNAVREFRARHGLLDPADAINEEQRIEATYERAARRSKQAMAIGDRASAKAAVAEMEKVARQTAVQWREQAYLEGVIARHAELRDAPAVKRCLRGLSKDERHEILDPDTLLSLGMRGEAIARARQDIARELEELREKSDPNIHGPADSIRESLEFLAGQGAKDEARRWLRRTLKEMPAWPAVEAGWTTSAVYHSLARAAATIDGPAAAERFLDLALADAKDEKRRGFGRGAVDAALDLKADLGRLDEAIEDARNLRSPTQRRKELATLLAKAKRWGELRQVLSQVASPEEAAQLAWWVKFELPGGEPR
jgi:hypothetical protein